MRNETRALERRWALDWDLDLEAAMMLWCCRECDDRAAEHADDKLAMEIHGSLDVLRPDEIVDRHYDPDGKMEKAAARALEIQFESGGWDDESDDHYAWWRAFPGLDW